MKDKVRAWIGGRLLRIRKVFSAKIILHPKTLLVWVLLSCAYQLLIPFWGVVNPLQTELASFPSLDLEILYPTQVPRNPVGTFFQVPGGKRTVPLTLRATDASVQTFLLRAPNLFFEDDEGKVHASQISLTLTPENQAVTLWIWSPIRNSQQEIRLEIQSPSSSSTSGEVSSLRLPVETHWHYVTTRLLHLLLGLPPVTLLGAGVALYRFIGEEQEKEEKKRRQRQQEFGDALASLQQASIEDWGLRFIELWRQFSEPWARQTLKQKRPPEVGSAVIGQPWLLGWKKRTLNRIKEQTSNQGGEAPSEEELLPQDLPEIFEPAREAVALFQEVRTESENGTVDPEKAIQLIHLWGLGIVDWLLEQPWLQRLSQKGLRKIYYGSAAGRFLILRLKAEKSISIPEEWLQDPSPPHPLRPPLALWPDAPPPILEGEEVQIENPFGPERAEEDPRLPLPFRREDSENSKEDSENSKEERGRGLFWEGHPAWKEVEREDSTWFRVTPGAGTSALIWMGRHVYSYWGRRPALSLYLPLRGNASSEALTFALGQALFEVLLQALVQDPIWFLRLDPAGQRQIVAFLARRQRVEELLELLQKGGLPQGELNLVADIFWTQALGSAFSSTALPPLPTFILQIHEWMARNALHVRATPDRSFGLRLWIELPPSTAKDAPQWSTFLSQDETVWSLGTVKVFAHEEKPEGLEAVVEHNLRWTPGELEALFRHRIEQTSSGPDALTPIGIGNPWEDFRGFLADRGEQEPSTPKELIRAGNRWLRVEALKASAPGGGTEG